MTPDPLHIRYPGRSEAKSRDPGDWTPLDAALGPGAPRWRAAAGMTGEIA